MLNLGDLMELETQTRYTLSQNIYTLEQQLAGLNLGDLMEPLEPQTRYILSQKSEYIYYGTAVGRIRLGKFHEIPCIGMTL